MAWSTREIAELAGTSLRTVRHYHDVGLLPEPERRANGYKKYDATHLVRLLRIKRLVDLGFSLSQIAEMTEADDHPQEALRTLDAELAATIERLQRARVEIGLILRKSMPPDLPPEFATGSQLSPTDQSFVTVMSRVLGPDGQQVYADMMRDSPHDVTTVAFDDLPADADEATRRELAERMLPFVRKLYATHPGLRDFAADAPRGKRFASQTIGKALADLYNPAQLDVMVRLETLIQAEAD